MRARQLLLLYSLIALAFPSAGPGNGLKSERQPDLDSLIDSLQMKYSRMNGLAAHFLQVYQGQDGRTILESGRLNSTKPLKNARK